MLWTVIGSGPSGHGVNLNRYEALYGKVEVENTPVITANTAIGRTPLGVVDYALFQDAPVVIAHSRPTIFDECLERGVQLVSCRTAVIKMGGPPAWWAAEVEMLPDPVMIDDWQSGQYTNPCDPVGGIAVQYALAHGATTVEIWGFEGMPVVEQPTDIGMNMTKKLQYEAFLGREMMIGIQRDLMQAAITRCPEVRFVMHGEPLYLLTGDNLEIVV